MDCYLRGAVCVEQRIANSLSALGSFTVRRPKLVQWGWVLCVLFCAAGVFRMHVETDVVKTWVNPKSSPKEAIDMITEIYGTSYMVEPNLGFAFSKTEKNGNVYTKKHLDELWRMHARILDHVDPDTGMTFEKSCELAAGDAGCIYPGWVGMFRNSHEYYLKTVQTDDDVAAALASKVYPDGSDVERKTWFPQAEEFRLPDGRIGLRGPTLGFAYVQRGDIDGSKALIRSWQRAFVEMCVDNEDFEYTQIVAMATRSQQDEIDENVAPDAMFMVATFCTMILFCMLVLGRPFHRLEGRMRLGALTMGMVLIGGGSGFTLAMLCGVPFNTVTLVLPFIMIGIGVDDALVLVGAFDRTSRAWDMERRMETVMKREGVSITVTSLTDVLAFLLGSSTSIPSVSWFCTYGALAILCVYLSFVTIFLTLLAADEERRKRNEVDCCGSCRAPAVDVGDDPKEARFDYLQQPRARTADDVIGDFFANAYSDVLLHPCVKAFVICFFLGLTAVGLYGCTLISVEYDHTITSFEGSPNNDFYMKAKDSYDGQTSAVESASYYATAEYPLWTLDGQREFLKTYDELLEDPGMDPIKSKRYRNWYHAFTEFAVNKWPNNDVDGFFVVNTVEEWQIAMKEFRAIDSSYDRFLKVDDSTGNVALTAISVAHDEEMLKVDKLQGEALTRFDKIISSNPYHKNNLYVFQYEYVFWDQHRIILPETMQTMCVAVLAIGVIALLVLVHPSQMVLVAASLAIVLANLVGSLPMWKLELNALSAANFVLSVGLIVDPIVHIVHSFGAQSSQLSRDERVRKTLSDVGSAVFLGVFSTFLGIVWLAATKFVVFRYFFQLLLTAQVLGGSTGLILLPVVLSLVGVSVERNDFVIDLSSSSEDSVDGRSDPGSRPASASPMSRKGDGDDDDEVSHSSLVLV